MHDLFHSDPPVGVISLDNQIPALVQVTEARHDITTVENALRHGQTLQGAMELADAFRDLGVIRRRRCDPSRLLRGRSATPGCLPHAR